MAVSLHGLIIKGLKSEYPDRAIYEEKNVACMSGEAIDGVFIGSPRAVLLGSENVITLEAPACVAGSVITMVAKNAIDLGTKGQGAWPVPLRLYAQDFFSITTNHLTVGNVKFLVNPKKGYISCKKLTLMEDCQNFEIVKSWLVDDAIKIRYS